MPQRLRFDDKMLAYVKENAVKTIAVIEEVEHGRASLSRAAFEAGFDPIGFRRGLRVLETMADPHPKETPADIADYRTAEEMFYGDVFGISLNDDELYEMMPHDCADVMAWVYGGADGVLTEREAEIMFDRYEDSSTLEFIAKKYALSPERVRQIISRCIRKFRRPDRAKVLRNGMTMYRDVQREFNMQRAAIIRDLVDEKLRADPGIRAAENDIAQAQRVQVGENAYKSIDELGLSVRSYNCLIRAGFNTVRDLTNIESYEAMARIRNLGRKSADEIVHVLREMGVRCPITERGNYDEG